MGVRAAIRENRATVICGVLIAVALAAGFAIRGLVGAGGPHLVALVHDADGKVHELPLDRDASLTVTTSLGTNVIEVRDGAVHMASADCPNRTCVMAAPLSSPGAQIICLPHRLWIEVAPAGSKGGSMDVSLAEDIEGVDLVSR